MKKIEIVSLEEINGGGFLDGFCGAVGVVSAGTYIATLMGATITTGGAAAVVAGVVIGGCAAYGAYLLF